MPDDLDAAIADYQRARAAVPAAQESARRLVAEARDDVIRAREQLAAAIVDAARQGVRQKEIVARTGYTRETVRTILRRGGVEPSSDD